MYKWENIQTKTEAEYIFESLKDKIIYHNVKRVFSMDALFPSKSGDEYTTGGCEHPLYILFDDDNCLIINFMFYSELYMEYRMITKEELGKINEKEIDYLNFEINFHEWDYDDSGKRLDGSHVKEIINMNGKYDKLESVKVIGFNHEYWKWVNNGEGCGMVLIPAGGDYFDELIFTLKNGIEIHICPEDAEADGYQDIIIRDINNVIEYNVRKSETK